MSDWIKVATLEECPPGSLYSVMVGGEPVVLVNVDGTVHALLDRCSHEDYPLSDGEVEGTNVVCTYHGARFDAASGAARGLPAVKPVKSYPVEVRDGDVYVQEV